MQVGILKLGFKPLKMMATSLCGLFFFFFSGHKLETNQAASGAEMEITC